MAIISLQLYLPLGASWIIWFRFVKPKKLEGLIGISQYWHTCTSKLNALMGNGTSALGKGRSAKMILS